MITDFLDLVTLALPIAGAWILSGLPWSDEEINETHNFWMGR
jgi:hypothetical protein